MKQKGKKQSILKKLLSVTLVCGLLLAFMPTITVSAAYDLTITSGGEYSPVSTISDTVTISTREPVTLSGLKIGTQIGVYTKLRIVCTVSGVDLTLNNMKISLQEDQNIISFKGTGNKLRMLGTENLLENNQQEEQYVYQEGQIPATRKSLIHVPAGAELSIYGPGKLSFSALPKYFSPGVPAKYTSQRSAAIGGDYLEKGGRVSVMDGEIYDLNGDLNAFDTASRGGALIGGECCEAINLYGGRIYGMLTNLHSHSDGSACPMKVVIDGNCLFHGLVYSGSYTFTKGFWCNTAWSHLPQGEGEQIVRGGSFTFTEAEKEYLSESRKTTIEKGAQLTLSTPYRVDQSFYNYGTLVIDDPSVVIASDGTENAPGGELTNHTTGIITINPNAALSVGNGGTRNALMYNYGALNIEANAVFQIDNQTSKYARLHNYTYGSINVSPNAKLQVGSGGPGIAQLVNYSNITVAQDATFQLGSGGTGTSQLENYSEGVIENNGTIDCQKSNLIIQLGEIRGNAPTGAPVYKELYTSYRIETPTEPLTQDIGTKRNITIVPDEISYLGYKADLKVTSITQPQGVTNGLTIMSVTAAGVETAVEIGKPWNKEGFHLSNNTNFIHGVKLIGNKPGEYVVTYALVNVEDGSEITSSTVTYTVNPPPVETLSTLTGIAINGKAITPFDKDTLSYNTEIRGDAAELTVTAAMSHPGASYTVKKPDSLTDGINVVTITCTSQDKSSTTTYTVNVNKPKALEGIKALYLGGVPCEDFDSQKANSLITISDSQIGLKFTYTLSNPSDRVLTDTLSSKTLRVGNNICVVKIGDSRGALKIQHVITVKVVKGAAVPGAQLSDNTNLKSLTVNGVAAVLTNDPSKPMNVVLTDSRTTAAIAVAAEDSNASLTYTASLSIRPGNNLTTIIVKSSDQSRQVRYTLCIRFQTIENTPAPSTGATDNTALKSVMVGGVSATIPASGSIIVEVGRITEQPHIVVTTEDPNAAVQVKYLTSKVKTGNNMAQIIVQSSDKSKKVTYMLVYRVS